MLSRKKENILFPLVLVLLLFNNTGCKCPVNDSQGQGQTGLPVPEVPSNLAADIISTSQINLTWNNDAEAEGYNVYRNNIFLNSTNYPRYTDTGLTAATGYSYQVT